MVIYHHFSLISLIKEGFSQRETEGKLADLSINPSEKVRINEIIDEFSIIDVDYASRSVQMAQKWPLRS